MSAFQTGRYRSEFGPRALLRALISWHARRFPGYTPEHDTDFYGDF